MSSTVFQKKIVLIESQNSKVADGRDFEKRIEIAKPVWTFGSHSMNDSVYPEMELVHFQIAYQEDQWCICTERQDVYLDGVVASKTPLTHDGALSVGSRIWRVYLEAESQEQGLNIETASGSVSGLGTLLDAFTQVLENPDKEEATKDILQGGLAITEADEGILFSKPESLLQIVCSYPENVGEYSHSAVKAALEQQSAVIWSDSDSEQDDLTPIHSMVQKNISSILVAPLWEGTGERILGLLYLHRRSGKDAFSKQDAEVFQKIGQVLGAIMANNEQQQLQQQQLQDLQGKDGVSKAGGFVYCSEALDKQVQLAKKMAGNPVPILITGETGTGKEVMARWIHEQAQASRGKVFEEAPFVPINCGAIPENLIESELFGHEKGAFTGATTQKIGLFQQASGGTLFLDEIGELPMPLQVKFLRVLQEGTIRPVGGVQEIPVDVRIVAATHQDIEQKIQENLFREDLYYRLNLVHIHLPSLRERPEDIPVLATSFLNAAVTKFKLSATRLSSQASKSLLQYKWPGNVRELENKIQRACLHGENGVIEISDLGFTENIAQGEAEGYTLKSTKEKAEREAVTRALEASKANLTLAASILDVDRKVLRDVMTRLGIDKEDFKEKKKS